MIGRQRFGTYLIVALAAALVIGAASMLGWYVDVAPTSVGPSPTITVTNPAETVRVDAPRRPREYVTETVEVPRNVPGPTVTVTVTKTVPGPTVTKTVTATPDETVLGASYPAATPIVLNVDTALDDAWQVERAARIWNRALRCRVFTTDVPADLTASRVYWLTEVAPGTLMLDGQYVRALHTGVPVGQVGSIEFDRKYGGVQPSTSVHELGHALGLHHGDATRSIMNVSNPDRDLPSPGDVFQARKIQVDNGRCQP